MSFNFYNSIIEADTQKTSGDSDYYIMFLYKQKGKPTEQIEILKTLTPEQASKIKDIGKLGKTYYTYTIGPAKKNKEKQGASYTTYNVSPDKTHHILDKKLYKVIYNKKDLNKIYFLHTTEQKYNELLSQISSKKIDKSTIKIEEINFEDLVKKIKNEPVGEDVDYLKSHADIQDLINKEAGLAAAEKRNTAVKKEKEKAPDSIDYVQKSIELYGDFDKNILNQAANFLFDRKNISLLDKIIDYHIKYNTPTRSETERKDDYNSRLRSIEILIDRLNKEIKEAKVKEAVIKRFIFLYVIQKHPKRISVVDKIIDVYSGKTKSDFKKGIKGYTKKDSVKDKTKDEKPVKDKIKDKVSSISPDEKKSERPNYFVYRLDLDGNEVKKREYISPEEVESRLAAAKKNEEEYIKDKKEFQKWFNWKGTGEMQKPNIKSPEKYGDIRIEKIDQVSEMSATGTGAAVSPGEGEGVATKYAFAGPGGTKAKRKKSIVQSDSTKIIKADESYRIKNDAKSIFWESVRWLINNK